MKAALDAENLHPYLMMQPLGFNCPDARNLKEGYHSLPEYPFGKIKTHSRLKIFYLLHETIVTMKKEGHFD